MVKTFKFHPLKRLSPIIFSPPCILLAYGFVNEAIHIGSIVGVLICIIVASCFLMIPIILANHSRTTVIADDRGLTINALFRKNFVSWEDIRDYQKVRKLIILGGFWCYYVTRASDDKKIKIGFEYFECMGELNNIILEKAVNLSR